MEKKITGFQYLDGPMEECPFFGCQKTRLLLLSKNGGDERTMEEWNTLAELLCIEGNDVGSNAEKKA